MESYLMRSSFSLFFSSSRLIESLPDTKEEEIVPRGRTVRLGGYGA